MKKAVAIFAITLLASPAAKPSDNPAGQQTSTQAAPQTPGQTASPAQEQVAKPEAEQKTEQEKAQAKDAKKKAREARQKAKAPAKPKVKPVAKSAATRTTGFTVAVRGQYFNPSEAVFKDVYGGGFAFGGEVTVRLWKGLTTWLGGSTFSKSGKLTHTGETTKVRITPIGWGLEYGIVRGRFGAYAGAGLSSYQFRETNFIGDVSSGGLGWNARAGVTFRFAKKLFADARLGFSRCHIDPSGIKVNIGGLELGVGLGYKF